MKSLAIDSLPRTRSIRTKLEQSVASRVARGLSLVAGGGFIAPFGPAVERPILQGLGEGWSLPRPLGPTLFELFAGHPRDAGWAGFLLAQVEPGKPLLWVQERMAILEAGRIYPPGLGGVGAFFAAKTTFWRVRLIAPPSPQG